MGFTYTTFQALSCLHSYPWEGGMNLCLDQRENVGNGHPLPWQSGTPG